MHIAPLIRDLAVILGVAGVVTFLFRKIRQPVVLGYIVAGILIGPHTSPYPLVTDLPSIRVWGELGVIFLMFALGLEFTFHRLVRIGGASSGTALIEVPAMVALGFGSGRLLGWNDTDSLFLGGMLAISSTTLILKTFDELGVRTRRFAEVVMGVLVVEDLFAILLIVALSTVALSQAFLGWELVVATGKLLLVVGTWFVVGYFFIPSFLRYAGKHMDDETLTVFATGLCLLLVVLAVRFRYSAALGAFIMGSILAESREAQRIEHLIRPLKSLFSAVFFVSVGMLVDPNSLAQHGKTVAFLSMVLVVGKIVSASLGAVIAGQSPRNAIRVSFSLAQIGEFSFIIAGLGASLHVTSDFLYPIAVAVAVVTAFTTPYLVRISERCGAWVEDKMPKPVLLSLSRHAARMQLAPDTARKRLFRAQLLRFLINTIATTAVFLLVSHWGLPRLDARFPGLETVRLLSWALAILLAAPFIWGMFFSFRRLEERLPAFLARLLTVILLGIVSDIFFQTTTTLIATLAAAGILFVAFYRSLEISYFWIERRFVTNLSEKRVDPTETALSALAPWDLHLVRVEVHPNSALVGHNLQELDIRHRYGLNIVVIQRGERNIAPPQASDRLYPQDRLLVLGTDDQITRFQTEASVAEPAQGGHLTLNDYALARYIVSGQSPFLGKTIRLSGIREQLHALVVGLERQGERRLNPDPTLTLQEGDVLWLVRNPS